MIQFFFQYQIDGNVVALFNDDELSAYIPCKGDRVTVGVLLKKTKATSLGSVSRKPKKLNILKKKPNHKKGTESDVLCCASLFNGRTIWWFCWNVDCHNVLS